MTKAELNEAVLDAVRALSEQSGGAPVLFVKMAEQVRQTENRPLSELVAEVEGLPTRMPGLAVRYVQQVPGVRVSRIAGEFYVEPMGARPSRRTFDEGARPSRREAPATGYLGGTGAVPIALEQFAFAEYVNLLPTIAKFAQPEDWGDGYWVLKYRLRGLFAWLAHRRNAAPDTPTKETFLVVRDAYAAMPLGLRDRGGKEMALVFARNRRTQPAWYTSGGYVVAPGMPIAAQALGAYGRIFGGGTPTLRWPAMPEHAFDPSAPIDALGLQSSLVHHLAALDGAFLETFCKRFPTFGPYFQNAVEAREAASRKGFVVGVDPAEIEAWRAFSDAIAGDAETQFHLQGLIDDALRNVLARAREESTAALSYNARTDSVDLLLPFLPHASGKPVCAFTLARSPEGGYVTGTVLSMDQAYAAARVVKKQSLWWLAPPPAG